MENQIKTNEELKLHDDIYAIIEGVLNSNCPEACYAENAADKVIQYFNNIPKKIVVFKDGTNIEVADGITWEYENDPSWLVTI